MMTSTQTRSAPEIISRLAKATWKQMEYQGEPPIPTINDLLSLDQKLWENEDVREIIGIWVDQWFDEIQSENTHNSTTLDDDNTEIHNPGQREREARDLQRRKKWEEGMQRIRQAVESNSNDTITAEEAAKNIEEMDKIWQLARQTNKNLGHPLARSIHAWQKEQIPEIEPQRRKDTGILHHNMRDTFSSPRLKLTKIESSPAESKQMQFINDLPHGDLQLELPGFVFPETELVPALPLVAYENAEGKPPVGGRGAPISQRLFINVLVEYEQKKRGLYSTSRLNATYRDIKSWLYPNGTKESRKKLIPRLYEGMWHLHNFRFIWERREWNIISVDSLPTMDIKPDDRLTFTIRMPDGLNTGNGALIGIEPLREYGAQSAPKFRAWVRLAYLWDAAKVKNGGRRIYATIPEVLRNSDSYLVDAKGEVLLTGDLYPTQGGWKFRNGQMPQTAWYHPLAIHTGRQIRNPQADKVPILSDSDMVKLFYDHTETKGSVFRERLRDAKQKARQMQDEGRIVIEEDQIHTKTGEKGWRILEPYGEIVNA